MARVRGAGWVSADAQIVREVFALRANPEGWPNAIEEILRYDRTGQVVPRVTTEDVDIHGYPVRAGEALFLLAGGANRYPADFEHPDTFDTTRANAREHLSFGTGLHACLGATLARMELHIALQSLFERFPQITTYRCHCDRLNPFVRPTERAMAPARTDR